MKRTIKYTAKQQKLEAQMDDHLFHVNGLSGASLLADLTEYES